MKGQAVQVWKRALRMIWPAISRHLATSLHRVLTMMLSVSPYMTCGAGTRASALQHAVVDSCIWINQQALTWIEREGGVK